MLEVGRGDTHAQGITLLPPLDMSETSPLYAENQQPITIHLD
jgi:hypothetical protein